MSAIEYDNAASRIRFEPAAGNGCAHRVGRRNAIANTPDADCSAQRNARRPVRFDVAAINNENVAVRTVDAPRTIVLDLTVSNHIVVRITTACSRGERHGEDAPEIPFDLDIGKDIGDATIQLNAVRAAFGKNTIET